MERNETTVSGSNPRRTGRRPESVNLDRHRHFCKAIGERSAAQSNAVTANSDAGHGVFPTGGVSAAARAGRDTHWAGAVPCRSPADRSRGVRPTRPTQSGAVTRSVGGRSASGSARSDPPPPAPSDRLAGPANQTRRDETGRDPRAGQLGRGARRSDVGKQTDRRLVPTDQPGYCISPVGNQCPS